MAGFVSSRDVAVVWARAKRALVMNYEVGTWKSLSRWPSNRVSDCFNGRQPLPVAAPFTTRYRRLRRAFYGFQIRCQAVARARRCPAIDVKYCEYCVCPLV